MKQRFPALAAALCGLALAACGGDDPHVTVPEAPAGIYLVTTGSEDALSSGHYYVGEDGSATLAIEGTAGAGLMRLFKHAAGGHWRAVPPAQEDLRVSFLERRDDAVVITTLAALAALAGHYVTAIGPGAVADFSIAADGRVLAGSSGACSITGKIVPGSPAGVFRATLATSQCAGVPARLSGLLISHPDAVAQAFRLLLDADGSVYDWWAYTD